MIGYGVLAQVYRKDGKKPNTPSQSWDELFRELIAWSRPDRDTKKEMEDSLNQRAYNKIGGKIIQGKNSIQTLKAAIAERLLCSQEQIIDVHHTHDLELHYALADMPFVGTLTTTYDVFMDKAYIFKKGDEIKLFYLQDVLKATKHLEKAQKNPGLLPFVMKLHGDITPRKEIVLDDLSLRKYLTDERNQDWVDFFVASSVLFLGFEPETPDLDCLECLFENKVLSSFFEHWIALPASDASREFFDQKLSGKCEGLHAIYYQETTGLKGFIQVLQAYEANRQGVTQIFIEETSSSNNASHVPVLPQPVTIEVFILHAHQDEKWKVELENRLLAVDWPHDIDLWDTDKIELSKKKEQVITQHLNTASVFLLLISPDLLIREKQTLHIKYIMDRFEKEKEKVLVIPILVRQIPSRDMETALFRDFQFLPCGKKALSERPDKDEAYKEIIDGIDSAIYPKK